MTQAQTTLSALLRDRAASETLEQINGRLAASRKEREDLGAIPAHADPTAARVAEMISTIPLVEVSEALVSEWWPVFVGITAEVLALFGPVVAFEVCFGHADRPIQHKTSPAPVASRRTPAPRKTAAAPSVTHDSSMFGDVREWMLACTTSRPGHSERAGECYDNYKNWCSDGDKKPVSLSAFGTTMKGPLGVVGEEKSKRRYYLDIALTGRPTLRVA